MVSEALGASIHQAAADESIRAIVINAAGKMFIAGADIREFDKPPGEVTTGMICGVLDEAAKPFVAALHGTALGGG